MSNQTDDPWAPARASWWRLLFAIAAVMHAVADNIEGRVNLAIAKRRLKDLKDLENGK